MVLSAILKESVIDRFDHRNLNLDVEEFKTLNPTAENIAIVIYSIIRPKIEAGLDLKIRLYETERNFVEYPVQ
jgi:6-pyruvoyltetrahydropterin/6-carboxytetrahydropterin synthase